MGGLSIQTMGWSQICDGNTGCPLALAKRLLNIGDLQCLHFLGINRDVKREWRTTHRALGRIELISVAVEHTTGMINMLIHHYRAETNLARKLSASLKALQLEIGCIGNPFEKFFVIMQLLATSCWMKSF
jgi:hypothetical protein